MMVIRFAYEYQKSITRERPSGWIEKAHKIVTSDAKIKDVCATCNNGILGSLDGMAKKAFEKAGIFTPNFEKNKLIFNYDYNQISRWLLKVSYNSSRSSTKQNDVFDKYKNYILHGDEPSAAFVIFAGLMKPLKLTESQKLQDGEILHANQAGYVNPFILRISWAPFLRSGVSLKQIVIGALAFHIIAFDESTKKPDRKQLTKEYLKKSPGMTQLRKNKISVKLKQIPLTFVDSMRHHSLRPEVEPHLQKLLAQKLNRPK